MRIKKINKINGVDAFSDFKWDSSCEGFAKYNFIYGWNYAGKTTLSRLFRCLEEGDKHLDYADLTFEVETADDILTQTTGHPLPTESI